MSQPKTIQIPSLPEDSTQSLTDALMSFAPAVTLGQSWRDKTEKELQPARIRWARKGDQLWILAELRDKDIFNPETGENKPFFQKGDTFEIFLQPEGSQPYYEFHVGPANQHFRLRIPSTEAFANKEPGSLESWLVGNTYFESQVRLEPEKNVWWVEMKIDLPKLAENQASLPKRWCFNFGRYDYTRGMDEPVLSSSSELTKLSFHRLQEWRWFEI